MKHVCLFLLLILSASGALKAADMAVDGNAIISGGLTADGATLNVDIVSHRVGIGIPSGQLASKFNVQGKILSQAGLWADGAVTTRGQVSIESPDHAVLSLKTYANDYYWKPAIYMYRSKNSDGSIATPSSQSISLDDNNVLTLGRNGWDAPIRIYNNGFVGIGTGQSVPKQQLDLNGRLRLQSQLTTTTAAVTDGIELYAGRNSGSVSDTVLLVRDNSGNVTRINSHANPRDIDPTANCSFTDPAIAIPFSFSHQNAYIGKGQIVDMAKVMAWAEKKMKSELGDRAGRVIYTYDLPANETLTVQQHNEAQMNSQAQRILEKLDGIPWIKVPVGIDGRIPDAAFTEEPVFVTVMKKKKVLKKDIDLATRRFVTVEREEYVPEQVASGRKETRLRSDYRVENGELYRKPTINDINIDTLIQDSPQLPQWILERIKAGRQTSQDVQSMANEIRQILASRQAETARRQAVVGMAH